MASLRLDGDHLQLDPCARVQRGHLHGGPRRRIGGEDLAVHRIELREVIEARDVGGHRGDIFEIHAGRPEHLARIGQHLARLGFDAAGHQPAGDRIPSEVAGDVERVASQNPWTEGKPGVRSFLGANDPPMGPRLRAKIISLPRERHDNPHDQTSNARRADDAKTITRHDGHLFDAAYEETGRCARRNERIWRTARGIRSFGSFHGNMLTSAFGASIAASMATAYGCAGISSGRISTGVWQLRTKSRVTVITKSGLLRYILVRNLLTVSIEISGRCLTNSGPQVFMLFS